MFRIVPYDRPCDIDAYPHYNRFVEHAQAAAALDDLDTPDDWAIREFTPAVWQTQPTIRSNAVQPTYSTEIQLEHAHGDGQCALRLVNDGETVMVQHDQLLRLAWACLRAWVRRCR